jgi:hypothetical protein
MGYSFSTPCKSKKARDEMFAFLEVNYRAWDKIVEGLKEEVPEDKKRRLMPFITFDTRLRGPLTEDLSYDHSKYKIGFDYGAGFSDGERYWMYNFCYWMAQRVGRRRTFTNKAKDCGAVPYVLYDGHEAWPVLEKSEYGDKVGEDNEWTVENGFRGMVSLIEWEERVHQERMEEAETKTEAVQEKGFQMVRDMTDWFAGRRKASELVDKAIKAELTRLTELWEAR